MGIRFCTAGGSVTSNELFAAYLAEREGKRILQRPEGFAIYGFDCVPGISFPHCYLQDIYVSPDYRQSGVAAKLADQVHAEAKALGINALIGSVDGNAKGAHESLLVLIAYGMKLLAIDGSTAWFIKQGEK